MSYEHTMDDWENAILEQENDALQTRLRSAREARLAHERVAVYDNDDTGLAQAREAHNAEVVIVAAHKAEEVDLDNPAATWFASTEAARLEASYVPEAWVSGAPKSRFPGLLYKMRASRGFFERIADRIDPSMPAVKQRAATRHALSRENAALYEEVSNEENSLPLQPQITTQMIERTESVLSEGREKLRKTYERRELRKKAAGLLAGAVVIGAVVHGLYEHNKGITEFTPEYDRTPAVSTDTGSTELPAQGAASGPMSELKPTARVSSGDGITQVIVKQAAAQDLEITPKQSYNVYRAMERVAEDGDFFKNTTTYEIPGSDGSTDYGIAEAGKATFKNKVFKKLKNRLRAIYWQQQTS